jgi:hypothetical protein
MLSHLLHMLSTMPGHCHMTHTYIMLLPTTLLLAAHQVKYLLRAHERQQCGLEAAWLDAPPLEQVQHRVCFCVPTGVTNAHPLVVLSTRSGRMPLHQASTRVEHKAALLQRCVPHV